MNFEGFTKVASDKKTTTLKHPKGHMIRVVHGALSPEGQEAIKNVPHYADGTPDAPVEDRAPASIPPDDQPMPLAPGNLRSHFVPAGTEIHPPQDSGYAGDIGQHIQQMAMAQGPTQFQTRLPDNGIEGGLGASMQPGGAPVEGPKPASQPSGMDVFKGGMNAEAKALKQQGAAETEALNRYGMNKSNADQEYALKYANLDAEHAKFQKDVEDGHIDPKRFMANMDTGKKFATGVGLILGGFGSGLTGGENPVMKHLNEQIGQDIEAQKVDLGKKENLLSANLRQYGNLREAEAMTRVNMNDALAADLKKAAAGAMGPIAQARAQQSLGQIMAQNEALMAPLKAKAELLQAVQQGQFSDPAVLVQHLVPAEHQKQVFTEIQQSENANKNEKPLMDAFNRAKDENTILRTGAGMVRTPESVKVLTALVDPLIHDNEGRINELEQKHVQSLFPAPGDMESTIQYKQKALQDFINHKKAATTARGFGIPLEKFPSTTSNPEAKLSPQEQQYVAWARQNPNNPKAQMILQKTGIR